VRRSGKPVPGAARSAGHGASRHRLFFALVPDAAVRHRVSDLQRSLGVEGRAVSPPNLHVTLAFLGMQEAAVIPQICDIASRLAFPACRVVLDHLGQFGRGRVLWLGAGTVPAPLRAFQQSLVADLSAAGVGHDAKPWQFHLTLYRRLRMPPPTLGPVAIEWKLAGFELIESVGVRSGVEYHSLGCWKSAEKASSPGPGERSG
jgi:2'-5' RNA ligase